MWCCVCFNYVHLTWVRALCLLFPGVRFTSAPVTSVSLLEGCAKQTDGITSVPSADSIEVGGILQIRIEQSDHVSICVDTMYQHNIYLRIYSFIYLGVHFAFSSFFPVPPLPSRHDSRSGLRCKNSAMAVSFLCEKLEPSRFALRTATPKGS